MQRLQRFRPESNSWCLKHQKLQNYLDCPSCHVRVRLVPVKVEGKNPKRKRGKVSNPSYRLEIAP